jgi:hypothetical protein
MKSITHTPIQTKSGRWTIRVLCIHEDAFKDVMFDGDFATRSEAERQADDNIQCGIGNGGCTNQMRAHP